LTETINCRFETKQIPVLVILMTSNCKILRFWN